MSTPELPGIDRLYELYRSGSITDRGHNSDILQVAKAAGSDLSLEEFSWLANEVTHLHATFADRQEKNVGTSTLKDVGEREIESKKTGKKRLVTIFETIRHGIPNWAKGGEFQSRLWELPAMFNEHRGAGSVHYRPTRTASGEPFTLDKSDPHGTQSRLKAMAYSEVRHDPRLRDAWHAAQSGKLADLMANDDVWQAYSDPKALASAMGSLDASARATLTNPLRSLLESHDRGEDILSDHLGSKLRSYSKGLPSHDVYSQNRDQWVSQAVKANNFAPMFNAIPDAVLNREYGGQSSLNAILSNASSANREKDLGAWFDRMQVAHEQEARQKMLDFRLQSYKPRQPATQQATPQADIPPPISAKEILADAATKAGAPELGGTRTTRPQDTRAGNVIDKVQTAMDVLGTIDPSPITDGANVLISIARAIGNPQNAGTHLLNAGISAVSMIPHVGDLAKLWKYSVQPRHEMQDVGQTRGGAGAAAASAASGGLGGILRALLGIGGAGGAGGGGAVAAGAAGGAAASLTGLAVAAAPLIAVFGAMAFVVAEVSHKVSGWIKSMQPIEYSGNRWDSVTVAVGRMKNAIETALPFFAKASGLGWSMWAGQKLVAGFVEWIKQIDATNEKMLDQNRPLSQYDGNMAMSYMLLDANRIRLDMLRAHELSGAIGDLARSQQGFREVGERITTPLEGILLRWQSQITDQAAGFLVMIDILTGISTVLTTWLGAAAQNHVANTQFQHAIEQRTKQMQPNKLGPQQPPP